MGYGLGMGFGGITIKGLLPMCVAALAAAAPANAVMINKHYNFTMNYDRGSFPAIWGSFNATYDTDGGEVLVDHFSSNLPSVYRMNSGSAYRNVLTIGTDCDVHGCSVTSGRNDLSFVFVVDRDGDAIYPYSFVYARAADYTLFDGDRENFSISQAAVAPVPEPATWAMLIAGFGLAGSAVRRRKLSVRFARG